MQQFQEDKTERKLEQLKRKEEETSVSQLAHRYGISYANMVTYPVEIDAIKVVPEASARAGFLAVFQISGKNLKVAVQNPDKVETIRTIEKLKKDGYVPELFLVSEHGLQHTWKYYKKVPKEHEFGAGAIQVSETRLNELRGKIKTFAEIKKHVEETFAGKTTEALEVILAGALAVDASDIHIEPQTVDVRLRFRLDGVLHDISPLPKKLFQLLLSRIKLISELKLNVHDKAQDGRFTIRTTEGDIEVRTSVLPGPDGENVVLRVLNPKTIQISFEELGVHPTVVHVLETELGKPNGMILTTGPTGSGKTTALYAFMRKIYTPEIKIITLEDPIEYHLQGIEQTQVDAEKGYDFANGLRAIVRQDPDIIMVGEIRDFDTAETAVNAALTGHLVFSTLHTNNAAGAIPRLINLGVKAESIAPALNIAMAQRLIRKLCPKCKAAVDIEKEKAGIQKELAAFPKNFPVPEAGEWKLFEAREGGCEACNNTGYKGRVGVFEIILINGDVEKLILAGATEYDLQKAASDQGQITMRQDGFLKILRGLTSLLEVERVVGS